MVINPIDRFYLSMKLVAITGGNGLIGRRLIQRLLDEGYRVRALVRQTDLPWNEVETVTGNITSESSLRKLVDGADTVFHCAAELQDESKMHEINVMSTVTLSRIAADLGVSCFIHLSSAGVTGPSSIDWIDEQTPCAPANAYEISKWRAEQELLRIPFKDMRLIMLRPTNVVDRSRPGILAMALRNNWYDIISLLIKGREFAHIIHAEDVAAAALYVAESRRRLSGTFIVGCDEDRRNTVSQIYNLVRSKIGHDTITENFCMPVGVPYLIRYLFRGRSLHGRSRFSSSKLLATGFTYPLGLDGAIERICTLGER